METKKNWFELWFNSPYYHILYNSRNEAEAELFIDKLCAFLKPTNDAKMLDIACGKGRHSLYLNKKGFDVTGTDLSYASIRFAKKFENSKLSFFVQDMRNLFYINYFDFAFNLFTSFGYFDTDNDHIKALKSFRKSLKKDGLLVLDYLNSKKISQNLIPTETKKIEDITFNINRKIVNYKIVKTISFTHQNKDFCFTEEVKAFSYTDFEKLFTAAGLQIVNTFGDYNLAPFDTNKSDRLIFICNKI